MYIHKALNFLRGFCTIKIIKIFFKNKLSYSILYILSFSENPSRRGFKEDLMFYKITLKTCIKKKRIVEQFL